MKFSINDFFSKCDQIRSFLMDLITFTEEILNEKLHFLCSECFRINPFQVNVPFVPPPFPPQKASEDLWVFIFLRGDRRRLKMS